MAAENSLLLGCLGPCEGQSLRCNELRGVLLLDGYGNARLISLRRDMLSRFIRLSLLGRQELLHSIGLHRFHEYLVLRLRRGDRMDSVVSHQRGTSTVLKAGIGEELGKDLIFLSD